MSPTRPHPHDPRALPGASAGGRPGKAVPRRRRRALGRARRQELAARPDTPRPRARRRRRDDRPAAARGAARAPRRRLRRAADPSRRARARRRLRRPARAAAPLDRDRDRPPPRRQRRGGNAARRRRCRRSCSRSSAWSTSRTATGTSRSATTCCRRPPASRPRTTSSRSRRTRSSRRRSTRSTGATRDVFRVTRGGLEPVTVTIRVVGKGTRTVRPMVVNLDTGYGVSYAGSVADGEELRFESDGRVMLAGASVARDSYAFRGGVFADGAASHPNDFRFSPSPGARGDVRRHRAGGGRIRADRRLPARGRAARGRGDVARRVALGVLRPRRPLRHAAPASVADELTEPVFDAGVFDESVYAPGTEPSGRRRLRLAGARAVRGDALAPAAVRRARRRRRAAGAGARAALRRAVPRRRRPRLREVRRRPLEHRVRPHSRPRVHRPPRHGRRRHPHVAARHGRADELTHDARGARHGTHETGASECERRRARHRTGLERDRRRARRPLRRRARDRHRRAAGERHGGRAPRRAARRSSPSRSRAATRSRRCRSSATRRATSWSASAPATGASSSRPTASRTRCST